MPESVKLERLDRVIGNDLPSRGGCAITRSPPINPSLTQMIGVTVTPLLERARTAEKGGTTSSSLICRELRVVSKNTDCFALRLSRTNEARSKKERGRRSPRGKNAEAHPDVIETTQYVGGSERVEIIGTATRQRVRMETCSRWKNRQGYA